MPEAISLQGLTFKVPRIRDDDSTSLFEIVKRGGHDGRGRNVRREVTENFCNIRVKVGPDRTFRASSTAGDFNQLIIPILPEDNISYIHYSVDRLPILSSLFSTIQRRTRKLSA